MVLFTNFLFEFLITKNLVIIVLVKITGIIFLLFGLAATVSAQQVKHDTLLIQQIDTMFKNDQLWRKEMMKKESTYSQDAIEKRMAQADSINALKAKAIISKYGYPGYSLVGERSNDFWAIVQHCDDDIPFQEGVLALMKKEIARNNASKENYAYLLDRVLVNKHQKQIYGTQVRVDPKTHVAKPFPLKYPKTVDALRKKMEMQPLAEYMKNFQ